MATSVLVTALRHARDSWRGQLTLLLVGGPIVALVMAFGTAQLFIVPAIALLLVGWAVRTADRRQAAFAEAAELPGMVPRLLAQVGIAVIPMAVLGWATLELAGVMPLLGLPLIVGLFPLAMASALVALLATVAVVRGDEAWVPGIAVRCALARPWALLASFIVGCVALGLAAVPIVLVGFVLMSQLGWLGILALGIASAAMVPLTGCWALALFEHAGGQVAPRAVADDELAPDLAAAFRVAAGGWVAGPSWDARIDAVTPWGTWVQLPAAADVALQVSWSGAVAPQLSIGREDGTWSAPTELAANGALVPITLLGGNSYLQLACREAGPQVVGIVLHARASAAA